MRPKAPAPGSGAGLALRAGRAKPVKAVFFRPNATAGAETRRVVPTGSTPTTTTAGDGISYAARVVGVENPLAAAARARHAAAADRSRRESVPARPGSYSSSSSFSSYSYSSGGGSGGSSGSHHGGIPRPEALRLAAAPTASGALPALTEPAAANTVSGTSTSSGQSSASRTYSQTLADGRTVSVNEADQFTYSQGPGRTVPVTSRLHAVVVSGRRVARETARRARSRVGAGAVGKSK